MSGRLKFEIDTELEPSLITSRAGIPSLIEVYRLSGTAAVVADKIKFKTRKRGLSASEMVESFLALWAAGGERTEDFDHLREDKALCELLGHDLPAAQTARDFLSQFHEDDLPLLQDGKASVSSESAALQGLACANKEVILDLQCRKPQKIATLDIDATIIHSSKKAAKRAYDGERGYQPVLVLWAEQDVIVADEFRDGNVPAGMGNLRIIQKAVAALPGKFDEIRLRGDSALYEHGAMTWMDENRVRYAISVRMSQQIKGCIEELPENHWKAVGEEADAIREWAEINYVPDDRNFDKEFATPRRYLAIRIKPKQGELLGDGTRVKHFAIVTNRNDPEGGTGLDLIRWPMPEACLRHDAASAGPSSTPTTCS
ncbi:MAG: transposase [Hyphomicrobium aestuarii]|nr:transposase [Hyphomicrobium aestuarii]